MRVCDRTKAPIRNLIFYDQHRRTGQLSSLFGRRVGRRTRQPCHAGTVANRGSRVRHSATIARLRGNRLSCVFAISLFGRNISVPRIGRVIVLHRAGSDVVFARRLNHNLHGTDNGSYIIIVSFVNGCTGGCLVPVTLCNGANSHSMTHGGLRHRAVNISSVDFSGVTHRHILTSLSATSLSGVGLLDRRCRRVQCRLKHVPVLVSFTHHSTSLIFAVTSGGSSCLSFIHSHRGDLSHNGGTAISCLRRLRSASSTRGNILGVLATARLHNLHPRRLLILTTLYNVS